MVIFIHLVPNSSTFYLRIIDSLNTPPSTANSHFLEYTISYKFILLQLSFWQVKCHRFLSSSAAAFFLAPTSPQSTFPELVLFVSYVNLNPRFAPFFLQHSSSKFKSQTFTISRQKKRR
jgi:hypothetical protein